MGVKAESGATRKTLESKPLPAYTASMLARKPASEPRPTAHPIRALSAGRNWANALLVLAWVAASGCSTTEHADAPVLASVVLRGNTPGQISSIATEVFKAHDYKVTAEGRDRLVLEKKGSRMNNIAYGSWLSEDPMWVRVRVSIVPVEETAFRLQCRAWLVRDIGSAAEEEIKIGRMHRRPYEEMLEEVAARLGANSAAWPGGA